MAVSQFALLVVGHAVTALAVLACCAPSHALVQLLSGYVQAVLVRVDGVLAPVGVQVNLVTAGVALVAVLAARAALVKVRPCC